MSVTTPEVLKICPQCDTRNALDSVQCRCGYLFAGHSTESSGSSDLVAQAEALYEYYLSTRLSRAVKAAKAAQSEALRDSESAVKAANLKRAEEEVRLLQAQLALQAARTTQARLEPQRSGSATPSTAFTEHQATRAEGIAEGARDETAAANSALGTSTAAFALAQSRRAERTLRDDPQAASAAQTAAPFISDEEFAALRRSSIDASNT
jgi:hypothetical protein